MFVDLSCDERNIFDSQKHSSFFWSVARDALQLYAEYFKYKVYFCKGDIETRDFIFTTCWCGAVCFVVVDHCELPSCHQLCCFESPEHVRPFPFKFSLTGISNFMEFNLSSLQTPSSSKLGVILLFSLVWWKKVFNTEAQNHLSKLQLSFCHIYIYIDICFIFVFDPKKPLPAVWNSSHHPHPTSQTTKTCHVAAPATAAGPQHHYNVSSTVTKYCFSAIFAR